MCFAPAHRNEDEQALSTDRVEPSADQRAAQYAQYPTRASDDRAHRKLRKAKTRSGVALITHSLTNIIIFTFARAPIGNNAFDLTSGSIHKSPKTLITERCRNPNFCLLKEFSHETLDRKQMWRIL